MKNNSCSFIRDEYVEKTELLQRNLLSELIAEEFRQSPTRLMSFVLDTGVMPSGITSQEQLDTWNEDKVKKIILILKILWYNL